ncbi:alpha/beta hydrolase [Flavobacteriaceae bacterium GF1]
MTGNFIDTLRFGLKRRPSFLDPNIGFLHTDHGVVRVLDTGGTKPVILNVPDGPNVIEHHLGLIKELSRNFRVICFEFPGTGFSYPNRKYDYSIAAAAKLIIHIMDILKVDRATLAFSCSNGFYAIKAAGLFPERIAHLFLSQTPSLPAMEKWTEGTIPNVLKLPVIGQVANSLFEKKLARTWYRYALPKGMDISSYQDTALNALDRGGCFCLSGLVQGLKGDLHHSLRLLDTPSTMLWGERDYTHRKTDRTSILEHVPSCEIIVFDDCGHFPELEATHRYVALVKERLHL